MPAIYPEFETLLPAADTLDGTSLSAHLGTLDAVAVSLGVSTLSALIDARTMALQLLDEVQFPDNCPPVRWYPAAVGLATVRGLLSWLAQHPEQFRDSPSELAADLQGLEAVFIEAAAQDNPFHLLIDI